MTAVPADHAPHALPTWVAQSLRCPRTGAVLVPETNTAGETELVTPADVEPRHRYRVEAGVPILLP